MGKGDKGEIMTQHATFDWSRFRRAVRHAGLLRHPTRWKCLICGHVEETDDAGVMTHMEEEHADILTLYALEDTGVRS